MWEICSQLSVFEVVLGIDQVDYVVVVKEYSWFLVDQEEFLFYELWFLLVFSRIMDYLVIQIMDQKEGSLWDWYDFVWNCMCGIWKDIMQQYFCDFLMVFLIEKCIWFYIYCVYFMCEEFMFFFDVKINNENMIKCLQSLKEMYQDLRNKGVFCVSEVEFQGYNVLFSFNKGDILREV